MKQPGWFFYADAHIPLSRWSLEAWGQVWLNQNYLNCFLKSSLPVFVLNAVPGIWTPNFYRVILNEMSEILNVSVNDTVVRELLKEKIDEALKRADSELVFWDRKEMMRRTCMCWNTIQKTFFHDPRFPKWKVGRKWYFPARKTREFLEQWLREQPMSWNKIRKSARFIAGRYFSMRRAAFVQKSSGGSPLFSTRRPRRPTRKDGMPPCSGDKSIIS